MSTTTNVKAYYTFDDFISPKITKMAPEEKPKEEPVSLEKYEQLLKENRTLNALIGNYSRDLLKLRTETQKTFSMGDTVKNLNRFLKMIGSPVVLSVEKDAITRFLDEVWKYIKEDPKDEVAE